MLHITFYKFLLLLNVYSEVKNTQCHLMCFVFQVVTLYFSYLMRITESQSVKIQFENFNSGKE